MELVRGVDFFTYSQRDARDLPAPREATVSLGGAKDVSRPAATEGPTSSPPLPARASPVDEARLRPALTQLAEGISALHDAGKLHRDIKPSNILVTDAGRVVLLDFGVATELARPVRPAPAPSGEFVGTATYMAPEQVDEAVPLPASDWYSVGVVLYEALVGRAPFEGDLTDVLTRKSNFDPPRPSTIVSGVPGDLEDLCMALLARDPAARPSGAEILRRLGTARRSARPRPLAAAPAAALIGRTEQLATLASAFGRTAGGECVTVRVGGLSGMGKSTVVHHFLDGLEMGGDAFVLRGRAYEREAVPYKAVDGVVDALSRHLVGLEESGAPLSLPADVWALALLFPVLRRVPGVANEVDQPVVDPRAVRGRAFVALRELLGALSRRLPLVVFLDDVQWGDVDSATLLVELVRSPEAPPVLFVMTYRSDEAEISPFLTELGQKWPASASTLDVSVGPLANADAESLALALLDSPGEQGQRIARAVARESHGSPFLVEELVRSNRGAQAASGQTLAVITLEGMIAQRLEQLTGEARRVLETVAVSGRPIGVPLIAAACDAPIDEIVATLSQRRFTRTALRGGLEVVETTHDRIREAIVAQLAAEALRDAHERLARTLAQAAGVDPEEVAMHWLGAGDGARAAVLAEKAAEQAMTLLAFDRAARLFRLTLENVPASSPAAARCRERLAAALHLSGHYREAADAYLAAAEVADPDRRFELRREAAQQLLSSGRIEEGSWVLRDVLAKAGLRAPRSTLAAVFWLLVYRAWLAIIGLRFREIPEDQLDPARRLRLDALYTVANGFGLVEPIVGACMQARHLIEAIRGADGYRLLRAVSIECVHVMSVGGPETSRARALQSAADGLRERLGTSRGESYYRHVRGLALWHRWRMAEARPLLDYEVESMPYGETGLAITRLYSLFTDLLSGRVREMTERSRKLLASAEDHGDLYTAVNVRTTTEVYAALAAGDPARARRELRSAIASWKTARFSVQHWQAMCYESAVDLYEGRGDDARERCLPLWPAVRRSLLLTASAIRYPALYLQAQLAIASIAAHPDQAGSRIAEARAIARTLGRQGEPWADMLSALADALADNVAGARQAAIDHLQVAIARADAAGADVYGPVARHRLGLLLGGEAGRALVERATEEMSREGIVDPPRWAGAFLPGTWSDGA